MQRSGAKTGPFPGDPNPGGGAGGQVNTVVAGIGISVNATDPVNPIVSKNAEFPYTTSPTSGALTNLWAKISVLSWNTDGVVEIPFAAYGGMPGVDTAVGLLRVFKDGSSYYATIQVLRANANLSPLKDGSDSILKIKDVGANNVEIWAEYHPTILFDTIQWGVPEFKSNVIVTPINNAVWQLGDPSAQNATVEPTVTAVAAGSGVSVDSTNPAIPSVSVSAAYSGRSAARTFAFSNVAANYLPILQIPIAEYTKFGLGFDLVIRWSSGSSASVLRYTEGQMAGTSGSAIFELVSGYCPPQLWASGQNLTILERTNGATKEWYLQAQLAYLDLTATVEVVNGWTSAGITPTWLATAFVAGAPAGDNPTHLNAQWTKVRASANDATPEFIGAKLESSDASITFTVTGAPGGTQKVNAVAASTISGAPNGEQLYKFALNEAESAISQAGTGSGNNSGTRGFGFIPDRTLLVTKMRIWISQVGGSNVRLGIYDASGNRIAQTARFSPSVGIVTANLLANVTLAGGTLYYMALWTDDTTSNLKYLVVNGRSTTSTSPLIQRHDGNEMPSSMATGMTSTALRPWMMVSE